MAEENNVVLVRRAVEEIWNRGALDVADVLFAADYVNHAGLIPDLLCGPEAIKFSVALYRTAFPDLEISVDELTAKHDTVLLRWTARRAPLTSRATPTPQGTLTGLFVSRCADGKIVESWIAWDHAGVFEQLGLNRRRGAVSSVLAPTR